MARSVRFVYQGHRFLCSAEWEARGRYRPVLVRQLPWPMDESISLLSDAHPCRTEAEALRHAETQAMRWVDSRTVHELVHVL